MFCVVGFHAVLLVLVLVLGCPGAMRGSRCQNGIREWVLEEGGEAFCDPPCAMLLVSCCIGVVGAVVYCSRTGVLLRYCPVLLAGYSSVMLSCSAEVRWCGIAAHNAVVLRRGVPGSAVMLYYSKAALKCGAS